LFIITLYCSRLKRVDAIARATAAVSNVNLDRFAAQLEAAKQRWEADKKQKKLVVLQEHQGKAFARWAKRVARDDKEAAAKSKIKALELRIEALEKAVGAGRAHEVLAASVGGEEEEEEEKEVVEEEKVEETPREERSVDSTVSHSLDIEF
jgi:septal ring factor EnvC (AmiA/AmiB activator)